MLISYACKCLNCGHTFETACTHAARADLPCERCQHPRVEPDFSKTVVRTERRFAGSECESLTEGFHPDEVEEARREFPDTTIRDDGTVMWSKRSDLNKYHKRKEEIARNAQRERDEAEHAT